MGGFLSKGMEETMNKQFEKQAEMQKLMVSLKENINYRAFSPVICTLKCIFMFSNPPAVGKTDSKHELAERTTDGNGCGSISRPFSLLGCILRNVGVWMCWRVRI